MTEYYLEQLYQENLDDLEVYIRYYYKKKTGNDLPKFEYNTPEIPKSIIHCPYYINQVTTIDDSRYLKEFDDPKWHSYLISASYTLGGTYPDDESYEHAVRFGEEQFMQIYNEIDMIQNDCELYKILKCINIHRGNICRGCIDNKEQSSLISSKL